MIKCKKCIYWDCEETSEEYDRERYYNNCRLDGDKFLYDPKISHSKPDSLMYCDSEGYNAWIKTGPDFGCIHGKKKDV